MEEFKKDQLRIYRKLKLSALVSHVKVIEARVEKYDLEDDKQKRKADRDAVILEALYEELDRRKKLEEVADAE